MNEAEFWQLIVDARASAKSLLDMPSALIEKLATRSPAEIVSFEQALHAVYSQTYDLRLWAAATLVLRYCSEDVFYDFRGWLIAQGRSLFESVLHDPENLAEVDVTTGDDGKARLFYMCSVSSKAYKRRTGRELDQDLPAFKKYTLLNEGVWTGKQDQLPEIFPRLFAKFGAPQLRACSATVQCKEGQPDWSPLD